MDNSECVLSCFRGEKLPKRLPVLFSHACCREQLAVQFRRSDQMRSLGEYILRKRNDQDQNGS